MIWGNISTKDFIVIARSLEKFEEYYGNNDTIWNESDDSYMTVDGSFSFNNNGDTIILSNDNLSIEFSYSSSIGGDGNGNTLEKINLSGDDSFSNWAESLIVNGTPGRNNSWAIVDLEDFSGIKISEFMPNPLGDDNAAMPNGEWIEFYNENAFERDLAGLVLGDNSGKEIIITDVNVLEDTKIKGNNYLVVYMNGKFGFLNNEGFEIVRLKDRKERVIDEVSYGDSSEGVSWSRVNGIWQHSPPSPGGVNFGNESVGESFIDIEEIYDLGSNKKAEWGSSIRIKVDIFKGDTSKNMIKTYVEKEGERVSKETKTNVYIKFINYSITLPIHLFINCDNKFNDGTYDIVVEGLEKKDSKNVNIEGGSNACNEKPSGNVDYELVSVSKSVDIGEEAVSKVKVRNNLGKAVNIEAWSYIFNGPKVYFGERTDNIKLVNVEAGESKIIELSNPVIEEGNYKIKINVKREELKTPKSFTEEIEAKYKENKDVEVVPLLKEESYINKNNKITSEVVYESTDVKAKRSALFFFSGLLILIIAVLAKENGRRE